MKFRTLIHPLLMIAALFVAFSLYGAWYAQVEKESAQAVALATQVAEAKQSGTQALAASEELSRAAGEEAAIQGYFVRTADIVSFLESLQSTGAKLGSKVEVASVSSEPSTPHTQLKLALRITGPFDSVERTLGAIEYQPYDTLVQSLTLDTPGEGTAAPQWTAAVTVFVGTVDMAKASSTSSH